VNYAGLRDAHVQGARIIVKSIALCYQIFTLFSFVLYLTRHYHLPSLPNIHAVFTYLLYLPYQVNYAGLRDARVQGARIIVKSIAGAINNYDAVDALTDGGGDDHGDEYSAKRGEAAYRDIFDKRINGDGDGDGDGDDNDDGPNDDSDLDWDSDDEYTDDEGDSR
jgi:hypothetical protein